MSDESHSEEWWFEVRPKGAGRKQPRVIEEICSVGSGSGHIRRNVVRNVCDTCGLVTVVLSVWAPGLEKNAGSIEEVETLEGVDPTIGETFNAALAPSAEARTFTVSPGTQETLVMLEAILLAASTSASAGE